MFKDRKDAGEQLAKKLEDYSGKNVVVLALPRGGVVTGFVVAEALKVPLDIIAVHKIGTLFDPEYAIGAVDEHGTSLFNKEEIATLDKILLQETVDKEQTEAKRRSMLYRGDRAPQDLTGKTVLIVDDGIATGLTMRLAVRIVAAQHPEKIVVAVPVAHPEALRDLKEEGADEITVLESPNTFGDAVGAHYTQFDQVEDAEVITLMHSHE